jgi:hypothetical protein
MSKVIEFPNKSISVKKMYCECGLSLDYWLGADDCAYGMCPRCNLDNPEELTVKLEEIS